MNIMFKRHLTKTIIFPGKHLLGKRKKISQFFTSTWIELIEYSRKIKSYVIEFVKRIFYEILLIGLIIVLFIINKQFPVPEIVDDQSVLQNYIEWFGIIYTFVLTLIVGQTWKKYNQIMNELDREADALDLLYQICAMFENKKLGKTLILAIENYAQAMTGLNFNDKRLEGEAHEKLKDISECVLRLIQISKDDDECLKSQLLHQFNEVYDSRGDRFDIIESKLPIHIWILLIIISLIWINGFLWLKFNSYILENYILGSIMFSISFLFYLARDLDDPNNGWWKMKFESFDNHSFLRRDSNVQQRNRKINRASK